MRAPVLILVVLLLLACVGILMIRPHTHPAVAADDGGAPADSNHLAEVAAPPLPEPAPSRAAPPVKPAAPPVPDSVANAAINPPPERLQDVLNHLDSLAQTGQPDASAQAVNYLDSTNQTVRLAAVEALKHIGDRWVTNNLQAKAAAMADPYERVAYQAAIDFLKLPTMRDQMAGQDGAGQP